MPLHSVSNSSLNKDKVIGFFTVTGTEEHDSSLLLLDDFQNVHIIQKCGLLLKFYSPNKTADDFF